MAKSGTKKALANQHEAWVARQYSGMLTKNSGATDSEKGDVRTLAELIECKLTGGPGEKEIRKPVMVSDFEVIADQAWERGLEPVLALRFFLPNSTLTDPQGWVDLAVRLAGEDAARAGVVDWHRF